MIRFESGRDRVWESTRGSGNHTIPVGHVEGGTRHFRWESTLDPSAHERFVGMLISSTPFSSLTRSYDAALILWFFDPFHLFSSIFGTLGLAHFHLELIEMINNNNFLDNWFGYVRYYFFSNKISFMGVVTIIYIIINFITFLFRWSLFVNHRFTCFVVRWIFFKSLEFVVFYSRFYGLWFFFLPFLFRTLLFLWANSILSQLKDTEWCFYFALSFRIICLSFFHVSTITVWFLCFLYSVFYLLWYLYNSMALFCPSLVYVSQFAFSPFEYIFRIYAFILFSSFLYYLNSFHPLINK